MSEEVIKNDLKRIKNNLEKTRQLKRIVAEKEKMIPDNYLFDMDILLAIIETKQKEIEELKQGIEELKDINSSLLWQRNNIDIPKLEHFNENYISKDKVREILFDIGTLHDGGFIKVKIIRERLEEILESENE